jgi:hypothetical protein
MSNLNGKPDYLKLHRIQAVKKSQALSEKNGIDIYGSAIYRLYCDGFNIDEMGSKNIARLIYMLYHERWLLEKYYKRASYRGYWNLSDINNPHYKSLSDGKKIHLGNGEKILDNIRKSIIHSQCEEDDADINELIYDLCDIEIRMHNEDDRERGESISYKKLLKRKSTLL